MNDKSIGIKKGELEFVDGESMSKFLTANFPERKCTNVPGLYKCNGGVFIGCILNNLSIYPDEQE